MFRRFLRNRRKAKRIATDEARDSLLASASSRDEYLASLSAECADSSLIALLEHALELPGDVIECGVFRGASLRRIAKTVKDLAPERTVLGLDSFEGFPKGGISEADTKLFRSETRLMGKFKDAEDVPERLNRFAQTFEINLDLRKGYFEHTLPGVSGKSFCFLHLDSDTYASHVEVLNALFERITPGGIIVFDDYDAEAWPGARRAIDEFFSHRPEIVEVSNARKNPAYYVRKSAG